jgi:hypothetical protein
MNKTKQLDYSKARWVVNDRCVLPRTSETDAAVDSRVVGDPCIVRDEDYNCWRMFYFALGTSECGTAFALSANLDSDSSGGWQKKGLVPLANREDVATPSNWHKWWVIMEAGQGNRAARIDGRYWSLFVSRNPDKVIQAAHAEALEGPWHVVPQPILAPGSGDDLDSLNCDTPTAYWFPDTEKIIIFYKGYPRKAQSSQPESPFGSGVMTAEWRPGQPLAKKTGILMRPTSKVAWAKGWLGGFQLHGNAESGWYALVNASPTPPEDDSHREPAPSLGGWAYCEGKEVLGAWRIDDTRSPFLHTESLPETLRAAGMGVNFWRHHMLELSAGDARIFFNSGPYSKEQLYSMKAVFAL